MRYAKISTVLFVSAIASLPLLGGCDYDDHHSRGHDRDDYRAAPAGYHYGHDGYRDHDGDWHRDHDDWRRDRY